MSLVTPANRSVITASRLLDMIRHWCSCPEGKVFGSGYGSPLGPWLQGPAPDRALLDQALAKLRHDVPPLREQPRQALSLDLAPSTDATQARAFAIHLAGIGSVRVAAGDDEQTAITVESSAEALEGVEYSHDTEPGSSSSVWTLPTEREFIALRRLIEVAQGPTDQGRRVADFLLAWWNPLQCGGFALTELWELDEATVEDMHIVFGMIGRIREYPHRLDHLFELSFQALASRWRSTD